MKWDGETNGYDETLKERGELMILARALGV